MNFYRKYLLIIHAALLVFGCGCHSAESESNHSFPTELCYQAKHGGLDLDSLDTSDPAINAYLFDCAVSVTIPGPSPVSGESKSKEERRAEKERRTRIADSLLLKGINPEFKNEYGDTLLMSVISSFLPDPWKEKTVAILIEKGVAIDSKNANGDTALSLAQHKGNVQIITLLTK